jgi:hypothetical protein
MTLFRSTFKFSVSPKTFKKHIRYIIKELSGDKLFKHIISEVWGKYKERIPNSKVIDRYDLDKNLLTNKIPKQLKDLVIKIKK